jgi:hypothetical protein
LISFVRDSIFDIATHASGLILICTTDGHKSNHSIVTGTLNSINLSCKDFAFSTKNFSFIGVLESHTFSKLVEKVGLSHENFIVGLIFFSFSAIFSSTFLLKISFINEFDTGASSLTGIHNLDLFSSIFFSISFVVCLSLFVSALDVSFGCLYSSIFTFNFGREKLNEYKIHITIHTKSIIINALIATTDPPNIKSNNFINGHDTYHQNS